MLVNLPSPISELQHTPTPPSVVFTFRLVVESIKELGGGVSNRPTPSICPLFYSSSEVSSFGVKIKDSDWNDGMIFSI